MTTEQSFQKMLSNLNLTDNQRAAIQTTRDTIDQALSSDPKIRLLPSPQPSFFTGSYSRHTIIRPLDDIDLYVRVHYGEHAEGKFPIGIMVLMARALRRRYFQTEIKVDFPCVVAKFRDYKFEIVPAVAYEDNDELYDIPGTGCKSWVPCYPHVPNKWLTSSNHNNNEKFIPLIKILKQWNRANKVALESFHLELLTEMVFNRVSEITSYPQGIYDWMYFVRGWIRENSHPFVLEPGEIYKYVDQYLYDKRFRLQIVRNKLEAGLHKAELAYMAWIEGKETRAKILWRQMFGNMFPFPEPTASLSQPIPKLILNPLLQPKPSPLAAIFRNLALPIQQVNQPEPRIEALIKLLMGNKDRR